jgi:AcrR family transcriptional regulator
VGNPSKSGAARADAGVAPPRSGPEAMDARREQLLRAAVEVIGQRGFSDARVADVAKRAGTSSALVLYYFGTKDSLLTEALRYAEDAFYADAARWTDPIESPRDRLAALVRLSFVPGGISGPPESWVLWLDIWAQSIRHPDVAAVREEFDHRWRTTITAIVAAGKKAGEFANPVDSWDFAVWFCALLDGLAVQVALRDAVVDSARAVDICMGLAADQLGFQWSAGSPVGPKRTGRSAPRRRAR